MARRTEFRSKLEITTEVDTNTLPLCSLVDKEDYGDLAQILSEKSVNIDAGPGLTVPPPTPASEFSFGDHFNAVSRQFRKFPDNFRLPYVREIGVKSCIDELSGYFNCTQYKIDAVQFWFLDVVTDCLWRVQDEFQFPEDYQKIILEWIIYVIDLIRGFYQ